MPKSKLIKVNKLFINIEKYCKYLTELYDGVK